MQDMGIDLKEYCNRACKVITDEILLALGVYGEVQEKKIRERGGGESWFNQSGNLRSSIGYGVYSESKKAIVSDFPVVLGGKVGSTLGKAMIADLAAEYDKAYGLAIVAAMPYASYVEDIDGKDVLASAELRVRAEIEHVIEQAVEKAINELDKL